MPVDLDALEALLGKATPGEWQYGEDHRSHWVLAGEDSIAYEDVTLGGHGPNRDDMRAIAALHNAAPALIAELRALQSANRWRPIAEAPRDDKPVDLWTADGERFTDCELIRDRWRRPTPQGWVPLLSEITHFRLAPYPPEGA